MPFYYSLASEFVESTCLTLGKKRLEFCFSLSWSWLCFNMENRCLDCSFMTGKNCYLHLEDWVFKSSIATFYFNDVFTILSFSWNFIKIMKWLPSDSQSLIIPFSLYSHYFSIFFWLYLNPSAHSCCSFYSPHVYFILFYSDFLIYFFCCYGGISLY